MNNNSKMVEVYWEADGEHNSQAILPQALEQDLAPENLAQDLVNRAQYPIPVVEFSTPGDFQPTQDQIAWLAMYMCIFDEPTEGWCEEVIEDHDIPEAELQAWLDANYKTINTQLSQAFGMALGLIQVVHK